MNVTLAISKAEVFDEVARTASYTGKKMDSDAGAYDRIKTSDEDGDELSRFWDESRAEAAKSFVTLLEWEGMEDDPSNPHPPTTPDPDIYHLDLNVSSSFDTLLTAGMTLGLFSYFVNSVVSRWYVYANKGEATGYAARAAAALDDVKMKALFKRKPSRPEY